MSKRARAPSQRQLRVGEEIRHALANVFERGELRDPELASVSVTVSEVRISPDLKNATVFVTPLGGDDPNVILEPLGRASPYLRRRVAESVQLRAVPRLKFEADTSYGNAQHIDELLGRIGPIPEADSDDTDTRE